MDTFSQLDAAIREDKQWQCSYFFNESAGKDDKPVVVDLCEKLANKEEYVFPSRFSGMKGKEKLVVELQCSAIKCGFKVMNRNPKKPKYCAKTIEHEIYFCCQHGCTTRKSKYSKSISPSNCKKRKYNRKLKDNDTDTYLFDPYDSDDERCPFSFTVHLVKSEQSADEVPLFIPNKGHWVLKRKRGCTKDVRLHCGHNHMKSE